MKHDLPPPPPHGASVEVLLTPSPRPWWLTALAALGLLTLGGGVATLGLGALLLSLGSLPAPGDVGPQVMKPVPLEVAHLPPAPVTRPATPLQGDGPVLEVAFVMDTTGSMGGLIRAAKQKAWTIVNELANAQPRPTIRLGLVAFRDHGDRYLTQVSPLTGDLDAFYEQLDGLDARGGGDAPEAVDAALEAALGQLGWSDAAESFQHAAGASSGPQQAAPQVARLAFLMGDAPPHPEAEARARALAGSLYQLGIRLNAVQLGESMASGSFQALAQAGGGEFFQLDQRPETVTVEAPQDDAIVALQERIEATVLPYGEAEQQASTLRRWFGNRGLSKENYSARASAQCKTGRTYAGDLLQALESGAVGSVDELSEAQLPEALRAQDPATRRETVAQYRALRAELRQELAGLVAERDAWLRSGAGQARDTFDRQVLDCLRRQLTASGFLFGC